MSARDTAPPMPEAATSYEALMQFLYQAPIGLMQTTLSGEITMINPMSAQLLMPFAPDGDLRNLFDVLGAQAPHLPGLVRDALREPTVHGQVICEDQRIVGPTSAGRSTALTLGLRIVRLDDTSLMVCLGDISGTVALETERLAEQVRAAARLDALTALPNRPVVLERIASAQASAAADEGYRVGVLFINADRFSRVNVTLGESVGDDLLRAMAARLTRLIRVAVPRDRRAPAADVRPAATIRSASVRPLSTAARLGGDEFVVVLEGLRRDAELGAVAQRLTDALCQPYRLGRHQVHATVSVGAVLLGHGGADADALLQDANLAMREAKRAGGARYRLFEPAMKVLARRRGSLEEELHTALAERQFFVVYQPIVSLASGAAVSVEALVRWRHPRRGVVSPLEVIGVAEETGLISAMGVFVLTAACHQFAAWQRELGRQAPHILSVNVSRAQLGDPTLGERVRQALRASGLAPASLQLEVTESLAAQDDAVQARLHELKAIGVTLALDDFGTGYSSLACLHQLPVDVVKIDRSFVSQLETSAHHRVLVDATIRVARSLGMGTVAEGIETEGQAALLESLACDKGQGYWYARPLEADDATRWLLDRAAARPAPGDEAAPLAA